LTPYIIQDRAILWTAILASDKGSLILYLLSPKCTREKALVSGQQMSFHSSSIPCADLPHRSSHAGWFCVISHLAVCVSVHLQATQNDLLTVPWLAEGRLLVCS
jgi:hypothetical protein